MSNTDLNVDIVGREFVRQYYTVLNQRPDCLHLFFTQDSSLVHGGIEKPGEEEPAYKGQSAIRQKIVSLGFVDCHTKICQVDCQQTIGNGVLVQVSGELSNNGEPMRRFMQSFILVQQAPKKFYVHNDIFRYQDEVFGDGTTSESGALHGAQQINGDDRLAAKELSNHVDGSTKLEAVNGEHIEMEEKNDPSMGATIRSTRALECEQVAAPPPPPVDIISPPQQQQQPDMNNFEHNVNVVKAVETNPGIVEAKVERSDQLEERVEPMQAVQQQPSRPFSWASMASKNAGASTNLITSPIQGPTKPQATIRPERKSEAVNGVNNALPQRNNRNRQEQQDDRKWSGGGGGGNGENNQIEVDGSGGEPTEDLGGKIMPDDQQLFIGNLHHSTTDVELVEVFEKYGKVLDVKINRKGCTRDLPNFGFVVFDSHDAVAKALKDRHVYVNKRRINIEQKKDISELTPRGRMGPPRGRGGFNNRPSFSTNNNNNNRRNINDNDK